MRNVQRAGGGRQPLHAIDLEATPAFDAGEEQALIGSQMHIRPDPFDDLAETAAQGPADPAVLHRDTQKPSTVRLQMPPEMIIGRLPRQSFRRRQGPAEPARDRSAKVLETPIGDEVLESGMFAVRLLPEVPLDGHDRLHHLHQLVGGHPGEGIGDAGKRVRLVVRAAHAPADQQREPGHLVAVEVGNDPDVVGVGVDAVVAGVREGDLELARQIRRSVHRRGVCLRFGADGSFPVDPYLVVGAGARSKVRGELLDVGALATLFDVLDR